MLHLRMRIADDSVCEKAIDDEAVPVIYVESSQIVAFGDNEPELSAAHQFSIAGLQPGTRCKGNYDVGGKLFQLPRPPAW